MDNQFPGKFARYDLDEGNEIYMGTVPRELSEGLDVFDRLWKLRPVGPQIVNIRGPVEIPRRQAAFGADYPFSRQVSRARETPPLLIPFRDWARREIDSRLNGLLLNWYDGPNEYIGKHNDAHDVLFPGSPIVTISLGEERKFRMRPNEGEGFVDLRFPSGSFIVIPFQTNLEWKHEVPKSKTYCGRRISITIRAFTVGVVDRE